MKRPQLPIKNTIGPTVRTVSQSKNKGLKQDIKNQNDVLRYQTLQQHKRQETTES